MDETPWAKAQLDYVLDCYGGRTDSVDHRYKGWHAEQQRRFALHPSVVRMATVHRPKDYLQLALEFPHVSEKDSSRLAYTRSDADGANNRQLVTSIGKYLSRHWPHIEDHLRRDAQALYTPDTLVIYNTTPELVRAIEEGPRSCMASVYGSIPFKESDRNLMAAWFEDKENEEPDWSKHPYSAYRPEYGWSIATRTTPEGRIDGRALLYKSGEDLVFLRTYCRHRTDPCGWSETDFTLTEWLKYQGYKMVNAWPVGAKIHTPSVAGSQIFAPYVDGGRQCVVYDGIQTSVFTDDNWTHMCTRTDAYVSEREAPCDDGDDDGDNDLVYCEECDDSFDDDDMCHVGRGENRYICTGCRDNNYSWVRGSSRHSGYREYYCHESNVSEVLNHIYSIDTEYPPDAVVQLEDGDWAEYDDCVSIDGEYYLEGDYRVVYIEDSDDLDSRYGLKNDLHEVDGKYWMDEEHYLEFHPRASEDEDEEEVEDLTTTETT